MLHLPAEIFLHLIKMIIAPLVFSTLVYGIAHSGDSSGLGRIGFRAMAWFLIASLVSLTIGLILVNLFEPGIGLDLHTAQSSATVERRELDTRGVLLHIFQAPDRKSGG